jgi:hypothetical protein
MNLMEKSDGGNAPLETSRFTGIGEGNIVT